MCALCLCNHWLIAPIWSKVLQVVVARGGGIASMDDAWRTWIKSMFQWVQSQQQDQETRLLQDLAAQQEEFLL